MGSESGILDQLSLLLCESLYQKQETKKATEELQNTLLFSILPNM